MSSVIARAAIVPVLAQPTLRAEQVSQLVLGETGTVVESDGSWRRIASYFDGYEGWVHAGYLLEVSDTDAEEWRRAATAWSNGIIARMRGVDLRIPLRARLAVAHGNGGLRLPDGRQGILVSGTVRPYQKTVPDVLKVAPEVWALEHFGSAPYLWGGVTPWGVDCSGLVQTTYAARGIGLPRDAAQQAGCGAPVPLHELQPGDLLFFRSESGDTISHVAFAGAGDTLIHSTVACGGVVIEPRLSSPRGQALHRRLVSVRRMEAQP